MEEKKEKELERGGGGKIKRKTAFVQRPPPYARPSSSSWWNSATRVISSFFSKSSVPVPVAGSGHTRNERDIQTTQSLEDGEIPLGAGNTLQRRSAVDEIAEVEQRLEGETNSGEVPLLTEVPKSLNSVSENTISRPSAGNEISEIEERLEGKTISRDEFNRLREILESRVAAQSSGDEYRNRIFESATQAEAVVPSLNQDRLKGADDKKEVVYLNRVRGESSNSFLNSSPGDLVGASPIDIAKAYMGTRTSELGAVSQSIISQGELTPISAKGFVSHSSVLSPRPKSSICWPGAMVQEGYSYLTPQTHTGRAGIHTSQRTPYSRPVHSRSTSKLNGDADRPCNIMSTNMKQPQTPIYGGSQVARTNISSLNDGFGSVGPVRRARRKFHGVKTPSSLKGTSSSRPTTPFWDQGFDASNNHLSMVKQSHQPGRPTNSSSRYQPVSVKTPSNIGHSNVHPQSMDMARKILEHLDRTIPTPEKKSAELKLATSWRTASSSSLLEAPVSNPLPESSEKEVRGTAQHTPSLGSSVLSKEISSALPLDKNVSTELNKSTDLKTYKEEQITGTSKKPPPHAFGNKPSLSSISVVDPKSRVVNMRAAYNNNNGIGGFTFPVSAVGTLSEPPTPSVTPFSPIIAAAKPKEKSPLPSYSFGGWAGQALVFSFPCNSSSNSSAVAPKFAFGSNKARLCFRPVVEDAVC